MRTFDRPLATESPRQRELRERRARVKVRADTVERAGLPACVKCGGTTDEGQPVHLRCDCASVVAHLESRVHRIRQEHAADQPSLADVLAP